MMLGINGRYLTVNKYSEFLLYRHRFRRWVRSLYVAGVKLTGKWYADDAYYGTDYSYPVRTVLNRESRYKYLRYPAEYHIQFPIIRARLNDCNRTKKKKKRMT